METTNCSICSLEVTKIKLGKHIINKHLDVIFSSATEEGFDNRRRLHRKNIDEPLMLTVGDHSFYFCFVCNTMIKNKKFAETHHKKSLNRLKTSCCYDRQSDTLDELCIKYPLGDKTNTLKEDTIENIQFLLHIILDRNIDDFSYQRSNRFKKLKELGIDLSVETLERRFGKLTPPNPQEEKEEEIKEEVKKEIKEEVKEEIQEEVKEIKEVKEQLHPMTKNLLDMMKDKGFADEEKRDIIREQMKRFKLSHPVLEAFIQNQPEPMKQELSKDEITEIRKLILPPLEPIKPKPLASYSNFTTPPPQPQYPKILASTKRS